MKNTVRLGILVVMILVVQLNAATADVLRVIDGDTYIVNDPTKGEIRVRILGIDTPEKNNSPKLAREAAKCGVTIDEMVKGFGIPSTDAAHDFIKNSGYKIKYEHVRVDMYGRYLVRADDFAIHMLRKGFAVVYMDGVKVQYRKMLLEHQRVAMELGLGLWGAERQVMLCIAEDL